MPLNPYQLQVFNQWKACFTQIKISETVLEAALENMPDNVTLDVMYATCRMLRKFSYPIDAAWQLVSCSGSPAWVAKPLKDFNKATNLIAGAWGPAEYAASSGHLQSVATILETHEIPVKTPWYLPRRSLALAAALTGNADFLFEMIDRYQLDPHAKDFVSRSVSFYLALNGPVDSFFKFQNKYQTNLLIKDDYDWSLLHAAALGGNIDLVQSFMTQPGMKDLATTSRGINLAHAAAFGGNADCTFGLIELLGIDPLQADKWGNTIATNARMSGHEACLFEILVKYPKLLKISNLNWVNNNIDLDALLSRVKNTLVSVYQDKIQQRDPDAAEYLVDLKAWVKEKIPGAYEVLDRVLAPYLCYLQTHPDAKTTDRLTTLVKGGIDEAKPLLQNFTARSQFQTAMQLKSQTQNSSSNIIAKVQHGILDIRRNYLLKQSASNGCTAAHVELAKQQAQNPDSMADAIWHYFQAAQLGDEAAEFALKLATHKSTDDPKSTALALIYEGLHLENPEYLEFSFQLDSNAFKNFNYKNLTEKHQRIYLKKLSENTQLTGEQPAKATTQTMPANENISGDHRAIHLPHPPLTPPVINLTPVQDDRAQEMKSDAEHLALLGTFPAAPRRNFVVEHKQAAFQGAVKLS